MKEKMIEAEDKAPAPEGAGTKKKDLFTEIRHGTLEEAEREWGMLIDDRDSFRSENERLRAALEKYGIHHADCDACTVSEDRCACGLEEALHGKITKAKGAP